MATTPATLQTHMIQMPVFRTCISQNAHQQANQKLEETTTGQSLEADL